MEDFPNSNAHLLFACVCAPSKTKAFIRCPLSNNFNKRDMSAPNPEIRQTMFQMITGYWVSRCIYVASELGISDHLVHGPKSIDELANATNSHAPSLYRLMRSLASLGIYAETGEHSKQFVNTAKSDLLRSDVPGSIRTTARMLLGDEHFYGWAHLLHAIKMGENGAKHYLGMDIWQYYEKNKERSEIFNQAMKEMSLASVASIVPAYDFAPYALIVDIGGGYGTLMSGILQSAPNSRGIVFDLERVINEAKAAVTDPILKERCQFISGDFFKNIPEGADLYVMKHIIHDWTDEECCIILRNIRNAMKPTSKVLIMDAVIEPGNTPQFEKLMDMNMLALCTGRERTEKEFAELLARSGLKLSKIYNKNKLPIIESVVDSA
jgi:hypothetical protein